ncbi:MAG: alpha/beta fold hydrolase, partial [Gammaproteobacteria bacterium]|nr:alpha/beta fold hydrolase [Gammaproteobacteria bacterium]
MSHDFDSGRRRLFGTAALMLAAAELRMSAPAAAQPGASPGAQAGAGNSPAQRASNTTGMSAPAPFGAIKHINAGALSVAYAEAGPSNGPAVLLLHGWPYDIHSFVEVTPLLASAGYRVIVPYLRGYGSTRFLASTTPRNGQPAALAQDVIDLMDALKIQKATVAGFDWGGRSADIVAALWPQR